MEKKITKKERFMQLLEIVKDNSELVDFINHEIELLNKKAENKGNSKLQKENAVIMDILYNELKQANGSITISDLQKTSLKASEYSNQKISAMFTKLIAEGKVIKESSKGKSFFRAV